MLGYGAMPGDGRRRRPLFVPAVLAGGAAIAVAAVAAAAPAGAAKRIWRPAPHTTWQWQLTGRIDLSVRARMFDIDLFDTPARTVARLHARGGRAVCYLSAGSFERGRPDAAAFPAAVLGRALEGYPHERRLGVRRPHPVRP